MKFWKNKWCGDLSLRDSFLDFYCTTSFKDAWVVDVWDGVIGLEVSRQFNDWELAEVDALFGRLHDHSISLDNDDVMVWMETKDDDFLVKSYSSLASRRAKPFPPSIVWNSWTLIRASFFAWEEIGLKLF